MDKVTVLTIEAQKVNDIPMFYKSTSGHDSYGRFGGNLKTKIELPRLIEILDGYLTVISQGGVGIVDQLIPFKNTYTKIPFVTGMVEKPNGNLVKLPHGDMASGVGNGDDGACLIGNISPSTVNLEFRGSAATIGKSIKYKLRVYDLSLIDG